MTEQPNKDSIEATPTETTQPETEVVDVFDSYEQAMKQLRPAPELQPGKETEVKQEPVPAIKVETEVKPEVKPEEIKPEITEEEKPFDIKELKIKRGGIEIPFTNVIEEIHKAGQLQDFVSDYTQKKYDYYKKTQENSRDRDEWHMERDTHNKEIEAVRLENLANEINERNLKTLEYFENASKDGEVLYDDPDKAYKKYMDGVKEKAVKFTENMKQAMGLNEQNLSNFANKRGLDAEYVEKEFLPLLNQYVQPSIAKGQVPFKEDTFEVFYRGINYDTLVEIEKDKSFKEGQKTAYTEVIETKEKVEPSVTSSKEISVSPQPGFEDYEQEKEAFLNRGKKLN